MRALDIYRRAGQQVRVLHLYVLDVLRHSWLYSFVVELFFLLIFRLKDCRSSMKYARALILDVERNLLKLSRFLKAPRTKLLFFFIALVSEYFLHIDNVASSVVLTSHGGVCERST